MTRTPTARAAGARALAALVLALGAASACGGDEPAAPGAPSPGPAATSSGPDPATPAVTGRVPTERELGGGAVLLDRAAERGLAYVNRSGTPAKDTILESHGAGVALLDLGSDGDLDVVFGQGLGSLAELLAGPGADLEVFVNDGRARFERGGAPGLSGWYSGLAAGDVDGDGDADLVAAGFGDLALLLQDERGRLARHAAADPDLLPETLRAGARLVPGVPREKGLPPVWTTAVALFDADLDGYLDLFAGGHLDLDPVDPPVGSLGDGALELPCRWKNQDVYCGPRGLAPQRDRVLRGLGNGRFEERTREWLGDLPAAYTLAVGAFDADGDGDTDLYVANDSAPNYMLVNDGTGRFGDAAPSAGVAVSQDGRAEAGMGVAPGDVNRDGLVDFALTNFSEEPTQLYFGARTGFSVETYRFGLSHQTRALLSWGVHLADFDGDGWLELFTANGHVYPQADAPGTGTRYGQADTLYRLGPGHRAVAVSPGAEDDLLAPRTGSRGSALGDLDGDGRPDLVVVRIDGPAAIGLDRLGPEAKRLELRLEGPTERDASAKRRTPRDALGARVTVRPEGTSVADELPLAGEVQTASSYLSASSPWLSFGLGKSERYRDIEVRWPSGRVERLGPGETGRRLVIREGEGVVRAEPFAPITDDAPDPSAARAPLVPLGDSGSGAAPALPAAVRDAQAALALDQLERAIELLTEERDGGTAVLHPDVPEALWCLASALARSGRVADARPLCERFLELAPLSTDAGAAWHVLALEARARGDADAHAFALDRAEKLTRLTEAVRVRSEQAQRFPDDPEPLLGLALAWAEGGERERARDTAKQLVARFPGEPRGWLLLGETLRALGDLDGARTNLRRGLELDPSNERSRYHLALTLLALRDLEGAIPELRAVVAGPAGDDARFLGAHLNLARALLATGDGAAAAEAYGEYVARGGTDPLAPPERPRSD